jgi:hypothetical protein
MKTKSAHKIWANLISIIAALFKPACVLIFSGAFWILMKNLSALIFCLELKKASSPWTPFIILWLNLGLKPQERVTNKRLDLGQASVGA